MPATAKSATSISLKYIACSMETVRGFLRPLDAQLISALLSYQDENTLQVIYARSVSTMVGCS
jgi:hypothetical protein